MGPPGREMETEGVLPHMHPLDDSPRRSVADRGARVPKVLPTAELEDVLAGLIIAVLQEPFGGVAVDKDVVEPQELALELMEQPAGGNDTGPLVELDDGGNGT